MGLPAFGTFFLLLGFLAIIIGTGIIEQAGWVLVSIGAILLVAHATVAPHRVKRFAR